MIVIVVVSLFVVCVVKVVIVMILIVVNDFESDLVVSGFVDSFVYFGGNVMGVFFDFFEFGMKWLELLCEVILELLYVVVFWDLVIGLI